MTVKNFRHGRLFIEDGSSASTTPPFLQKVVTFSGATFTFTEGRERNLVRDRGEVKEVTVGDELPIEWSFEASFEDETSFRTMRDGVYADITDSITGLTPSALNLNVATEFSYEQNSLQIASTDPIAPGTKLAIAAVPAAAGEFSENTGTSNVERVIEVASSDGFNIFMPAADTDVDIVYDAVGQSTLDPALLALGACTGSINFFRLRLRIFDPCDPPSTKDLTLGTPELDIVLDQAWLDEDSFSEEEEADTIAFSGRSIANKVSFFPNPTGFPIP